MRVAPEGFILIFERLEDAWAFLNFLFFFFLAVNDQTLERKEKEPMFNQVNNDEEIVTWLKAWMVNQLKDEENKDRFTINYPVTPSRWMKQIHDHRIDPS